MEKQHKIERFIKKLDDGTYKVTFFVEDYYNENGLKNLIKLNTENLMKIGEEIGFYENNKEDMLQTIASSLIGTTIIKKVKLKKRLNEKEKKKFDTAMNYASTLAEQAYTQNIKNKQEITEALEWWNKALKKGESKIEKLTTIQI